MTASPLDTVVVTCINRHYQDNDHRAFDSLVSCAVDLPANPSAHVPHSSNSYLAPAMLSGLERMFSPYYFYHILF